MTAFEDAEKAFTESPTRANAAAFFRSLREAEAEGELDDDEFQNGLADIQAWLDVPDFPDEKLEQVRDAVQNIERLATAIDPWAKFKAEEKAQFQACTFHHVMMKTAPWSKKKAYENERKHGHVLMQEIRAGIFRVVVQEGPDETFDSLDALLEEWVGD